MADQMTDEGHANEFPHVRRHRDAKRALVLGRVKIRRRFQRGLDPQQDFAHGHREILGTLRQLHLRSEEHTSELQSLMRISYAVFCLKKKNYNKSINSVNYETTTD